MAKDKNSKGKFQENINALQVIFNTTLRKYTHLCSFGTFTSNIDNWLIRVQNERLIHFWNLDSSINVVEHALKLKDLIGREETSKNWQNFKEKMVIQAWKYPYIGDH